MIGNFLFMVPYTKFSPTIRQCDLTNFFTAYHLQCVEPPLEECPDEEWTCPRCLCEPMPGKVEKILTWQWREDESAKDKKAKKDKEEKEDRKVFHTRIMLEQIVVKVYHPNLSPIEY